MRRTQKLSALFLQSLLQMAAGRVGRSLVFSGVHALWCRQPWHPNPAPVFQHLHPISGLSRNTMESSLPFSYRRPARYVSPALSPSLGHGLMQGEWQCLHGHAGQARGSQDLGLVTDSSCGPASHLVPRLLVLSCHVGGAHCPVAGQQCEFPGPRSPRDTSS